MKKGDISPFIIEIIGSMIVVGIVIILFSGLAAPFLEFLVDYESLKSFNKFTATMSKACVDGVDSNSYIYFSSPSKNKVYMTMLVVSDFESRVKALPVCQLDKYPCASNTAVNKLKSCLGQGGWCWCLLKVKFNDTQGGNYDNCVNYDYNILTVERISPLTPSGDVDSTGWTNAANIIDEFNRKVGTELTNSNVIERIDVLSCRSIDELGCRDERTGFPLFPSAYGGNVTVLIQPVTSDSKKVELDSLSMQRPVALYGQDYYINLYTHPEMIVAAFNASANNSYKIDCPN